MKWETRALSEVCDIPGQYGLSVAAHSSPAGVPMLRMGNIDEGRLSWKKLKFVHLSKADLDTYRLEVGDLLFNRTNSAELVGKTAVFDGAREAVFASYIVRFRLKRDVADPAFICHFINSDAGRAYIEANMARAVGQVNISASTMQRMQVPLPPLPEQKRIAARLREQLAEVEKAREALQSQLEAAEKIHAAALRECFSETSRQAWPVMRLGDAADITAGVTLGRKLPSEGVRKVPYLRVANVKDGRLDLTSVTQTDAKETEIQSLRLQYGDLLLTEGGDPDKLGRGTFWRDELPECIHQNHVFRLRFDLTKFDPAFLAFQFGSEYGKAYFSAHAKQTTGIATINRKVLDQFPLLGPMLAIQQATARKLTESLAGTQSLIADIKARLEAVEKLPAALLREVFVNKPI